MIDTDEAHVLALTLTPAQLAFVDPLNETLANADSDRDNFVLDADNTIVGFFQIDRSSNHRTIADFLELHEVQIDARHQGKGYGKAFVASLIDYLKREFPSAIGVCLTVNCKNTHAYELYKLGGFVDTGELYTKGRSGPQHIMQCTLDTIQRMQSDAAEPRR